MIIDHNTNIYKSIKACLLESGTRVDANYFLYYMIVIVSLLNLEIKIFNCPKYFRMYLSIEGRSIEIDKKIDIFDITSKIAAVSAAPMYIEFNAGSRHHTR